jgi:hypothetical protein
LAETTIEGYGSLLHNSFGAGPSDRLTETFARHLDQVDREVRRNPLPRISRPAWLAVAAAVPLCVVLFLQFSQPPAAQASEIVARAIREEALRPQHQVRRIEIRTRQHRIVRDYANPAITGDAKLVAAVLQTVSLKWDDPLSARDFQIWRKGLADEVDKVTIDEATISVQTTARTSEAQERTLVVRKVDWHPIRQSIKIPGDTIDIEELAVAPEAETVAAKSVPDVKRPSVVGPATAETVTVTRPSDIRERQIEAWTILHGLEADVNEQLAPDIKDRNAIQITGVVETSIRRQQIAQALSHLESVGFAVRAADEVNLRTPPAGGDVILSAGVSHPPLLEEWLRMNFTNRDERSNFTARAFTLSVGLSKRASAIVHLATQFPQKESDLLSPHAFEELVLVARDFQRGIREERAALTAHLAPISDGEEIGVVTAVDWQCDARIWSGASRTIARALALLLSSHEDPNVDEKGARQGLRRGLEGLDESSCVSANR